MKGSRLVTSILFGFLLLSLLVSILGCGGSPSPSGNQHGKLFITSVNQKTMSVTSTSRNFAAKVLPPLANGYEHAGPADYVKVKIYKIAIIPESDTNPAITVWEDAAGQEITLDGSGQLPETFSLNSIPLGSYKAVEVTIDKQIKLKGSLTGKTYKTSLPAEYQNVTYDTFSVETKSRYSFHWVNPNSYVFDSIQNDHVNTVYTDYAPGDNGPEETAVDLYFFPTLVLTTPISIVITEGEIPNVTFVLDLSRLIRFDNGCSQMGGEAGQGKFATFYENHFVAGLFNCFIGQVGSVEGYEIQYDNGTRLASGWLTMIWSPAHELIHAAVISDDHSLSPDGEVRNFQADTAPGAYKFDIVNECIDMTLITHISGFKPGQATPDATYSTDGTYPETGTATFTMQMVYPN